MSIVTTNDLLVYCMVTRSIGPYAQPQSGPTTTLS